MSTQQVVCEHSLRGVLSSLSSPHHRTPWCGRACSQATQQALVRYSQKNANQWKRWDAFKLAICIMPIVLLRISLPHSLSLTMFFFYCFLNNITSLFPERHFCVSLFIFPLKGFPAIFTFPLCGRPFTFSEKSAAAVRNAYGVMMQIIAVGNKGREIA